MKTKSFFGCANFRSHVFLLSHHELQILILFLDGCAGCTSSFLNIGFWGHHNILLSGIFFFLLLFDHFFLHFFFEGGGLPSLDFFLFTPIVYEVHLDVIGFHG